MKRALPATLFGVAMVYCCGISAASSSIPSPDKYIAGRWCDRVVPTMPDFNGIYTIALDAVGTAILMEAYNDGSGGETPLTEIEPRRYIDAESGFGEGFQILDNSDLQLFDEDGPIRVASRLNSTPTVGECQ